MDSEVIIREGSRTRSSLVALAAAGERRRADAADVVVAALPNVGAR